MERFSGREHSPARLNKLFLSACIVISVGMNNSTALCQCSGYSVEVFAGPDCFLPSFAHATGIAETGAICGSYVDCAEVGHHVIWSPTGDVIEMPASMEQGIPDSPFEMNSSGQVVGRMYVPALNPPDRAFLCSEGITTNLGTLPGGNKSEAVAIAEDGTVCGYSHNTNTGPLRAFVWQSGQMSALSLPFGPQSVARDISNSGKICGWMGQGAHIDGHAFVYDLMSGETIDAGVLLSGAIGSQATGINDVDTICGYSNVPCGKSCLTRRSFIWSNGDVEDLGVLPGKTSAFAQAINNSNVVVGYCDPGATAFVWRNATMTVLNDLIPPELNLNFRLAWDINNAGQIVGEASIVGTSDRVAVRLTPIPSPIGDSDCDGDVDVDDLLGVINNWAHQSPKGSNALPPCDFDHDGIVEVDDLMIVIDNWTT